MIVEILVGMLVAGGMVQNWLLGRWFNTLNAKIDFLKNASDMGSKAIVTATGSTTASVESNLKGLIIDLFAKHVEPMPISATASSDEIKAGLLDVFNQVMNKLDATNANIAGIAGLFKTHSEEVNKIITEKSVELTAAKILEDNKASAFKTAMDRILDPMNL